MTRSTERFTVRLPKREKEALRDLASRTGESMSVTFRMMLREKIAETLFLKSSNDEIGNSAFALSKMRFGK